MISENELRRIDWVQEKLKALPSGLRLLDAGAGEQQYRKFCDHLSYTSQDFAAYNPTELPSGLQMNKWEYGKLDYVCDIVSIPVADHSFDVILCTEVFEHIPDPLAALDEFSRILKPGGTLILTAPFCSMTHFAPYHFSTGFSKYYYQEHLTKRGFDIQELKPNGNYFEYMAQETARLPHVAATYRMKPLSFLEKWLFARVSKIANRLSVHGAASAELMSFGWHVMAIKN